MNACLISSIIAASVALPSLADPKGLCLQLTVRQPLIPDSTSVQIFLWGTFALRG